MEKIPAIYRFSLRLSITFLTSFLVMALLDNAYVKTNIMGDWFCNKLNTHYGAQNYDFEHWHYSARHWLLVLLTTILLIANTIYALYLLGKDWNK